MDYFLQIIYLKSGSSLAPRPQSCHKSISLASGYSHLLLASRSAIFFHGKCSSRKNRICSSSMTYRGRPGPCPVDSVGLLYAFSLNTPDQLFLYRCSWTIKFLTLVKVSFKIDVTSENLLFSISENSYSMVSAAVISPSAACSISSKDRLWDLSASSNDVIVETLNRQRIETTRVHFLL